MDSPCRSSALQFLARVEKYIDHVTNPTLITTLLEKLHLHQVEWRDINFSNFIQQLTTQSIDLSAFLEKLKLELLGNSPLCTLLAYIQDNHLIADVEIQDVSEIIQFQLNMLCLLEAYTVTMLNSETLAEDLYLHSIERRNTYFPGNPFVTFFFGVPRNTSIFERIKFISIEPGILNYIRHRVLRQENETQQEIMAFIKKYSLSGINADKEPLVFEKKPHAATSGFIPKVSMNILEAIWHESTGSAKTTGSINNAKAGVGLISLMENSEYVTNYTFKKETLPNGISLDNENAYPLIPYLKIDNSEKKVSEFIITKEWLDLYVSWNVLFLLNQIEDKISTPLILLLPSVMGADPSNFMEARIVSLYLCANIVVTESTKTIDFFKRRYRLENKKVILEKWGEINKEYASHLLKECPNTKPDLDNVYRNIFGNYPTLGLFKKVFLFCKNRDKFRATKPIG